MKINHMMILGMAAAFSSCSTAYRSGQTPDDVYYSPAPETSSYVSSLNDEDRNSYAYRNDEEAQIRQGIQDPVYRSPLTLDLGFGYGYNPYSPYGSLGNPFYGYDPYGLNPYGYKGYYNPYSYDPYGYGNLGFYSPYNNFYSPYSFYGSSYYGYYPSVYFPGGANLNTNRGPRRYNLNPYNTAATTSLGSVGVRGETTRPSNSVPVRRTSGVGNVIRRIFTPSGNTRNTTREYNNSRNYNNNSANERSSTRSFSPPPSNNNSSSGSRSSSGSSAPTRTFRR